MRGQKPSLYSQRRELIEENQIGYEIRIKIKTGIQFGVTKSATRSTTRSISSMCGRPPGRLLVHSSVPENQYNSLLVSAGRPNSLFPPRACCTRLTRSARASYCCIPYPCRPPLMLLSLAISKELKKLHLLSSPPHEVDI